VDGVGEWATASFGVGRDNDIQLIKELHWPDSLGLLYSAFTYYTGFKVNSGEYKVMGLAPYGEPKFVDLILRELVDLREDGSFTLNQKYFNYLTGLTMTNGAFSELFDGPARGPRIQADPARDGSGAFGSSGMRGDHAAHGPDAAPRDGGSTISVWRVVWRSIAWRTGRILREGPFSRLWIQPAAGDAGARWASRSSRGTASASSRGTVVPGRDGMRGAYLGPEFSPEEIEAYLVSQGAAFERFERACLATRVAQLLAEDKVIGWFDGRMEFGPRALAPAASWRRAERPHASADEPQDQVPEGFPPLRSERAARAGRGLLRARLRLPYMLLVAP